MIDIRNGSDLRTAYEVLRDMQELPPLPGREKAVQEHIRQLKKDIRAFRQQQGQTGQRRVISDRGINGFVELVALPDSLSTKEEAAAYFEEKEAIQCPDSPVAGCTGRAFTDWYRIVCRQGRMWAYHSVSYDV